MKKIMKVLLLVLALIVTGQTAYATNSFATPNGNGTSNATLFATITNQADSWIELDRGSGYVQFGRAIHQAGEFSAQVPNLPCGRSYPYRVGAINPFNGTTVFGQIFNLPVNCDNNTNNNNNNFINISTDSASVSQFSANLFATVNPFADAWIEANIGNGTQQFGRANRSGSYQVSLSGLQCNTTYSYRAAAQTSNGVIYGNTRQFTTNACNNNNFNNNVSLNAITTVATGVSTNAARLNGIVLNQTTPTNAYFEWGTSQALGNRTQTKTYFESNSVPVIDVLTGLSANTTYFYRVVGQNTNGTLATGNIVSFRTESVPTTTTTTTNTGTNTNTITRVINTVTRAVTGTAAPQTIFVPVQLASTGSFNSAQVNTTGGIAVPRLASILVNKSGAEGCTNTFTITYTNTSDRVLSNALLNVSLPNEIAFVSASDGSFRDTDNTLTVAIGNLGAGESRTVTLNTNVLSGAQVGKTVAVTAYLNYTDNTSTAQDQVTGYTLLTLNENCETTVLSTGAGAAGLSGILPDSIWQWLAVIVAIILIVIAGRSLFASASAK